MTSRMKQRYHLEAPVGLLNDPNGLSWYHGKYHVFFQWNCQSKNHSHKEWGLFTSADLLSWQFEGSIIVPGQEYDRDGAYSGSGQVIGDQLYLYYTGNRREGDQRISSQCLAVMEDGCRCHKEGVVFRTPEEYTGHFRDPKVFQGSGTGYFMVVGGQRRNGKGAVALCRSADGRNWDDQGMLAVSDQYEMIECPDLFLLDGQWVLLYNPQKRDMTTDEPEYAFSAYKLEDFNEDTGTLQDPGLDTGYERLDAGFDFYAPQTMETPDGRRILFAWMSRMEEDQEAVFGRDEPNIHCLTLPRELSIHDGRLCQKPAGELYALLGQEAALHLEEEEIRGNPAQRAFYLKIRQDSRDNELQLIFHGGEAILRYVPAKKKLLFSRRSWMDCADEEKEAALERLEEVEVWSDQSSMEIFINGGETVLSARIFPGDAQPEIRIKGCTETADVQIREIICKETRKTELKNSI